MLYVLIIVSGVYYGNQVTTQEFNSLEQCQYVAKWTSAQGSYIRANCFAKGVQK